jgi:hypothetical protein
MGFKKNWDMNDIARQINVLSYECNDGRNDGFVGWGCKQDLYRIKWLVEDAIRRCPTYSPETEWLREYEKQKVIRILKDEL